MNIKKIFASILVFVAIASFGGIIGSARADEITPAERAALQQSLNVLTAKLLELQAQASMPSSPAVSEVILNLSPSDIALIKSTLASLAAMLSSLKATLENDPQPIMANARGISLTIRDIHATITRMETTLVGPAHIASVPESVPIVAQATPSTALAPSTVPAPSVSPAPSPSPSLVSANDNIAGESLSAQAVSSWSLRGLNWPVIAVGLLAVLAVILWLWWPSARKDQKDLRMARVESMPFPGPPSAPTRKPETTTVRIVQ